MASVCLCCLLQQIASQPLEDIRYLDLRRMKCREICGAEQWGITLKKFVIDRIRATGAYCTNPPNVSSMWLIVGYSLKSVKYTFRNVLWFKCPDNTNHVVLPYARQYPRFPTCPFLTEILPVRFVFIILIWIMLSVPTQKTPWNMWIFLITSSTPATVLQSSLFFVEVGIAEVH
jgi:hypothetical protein